MIPKGRIRRLILQGLIAILFVFALFFFLHYVPFDIASYCAWIGILLCPVGLVSLAIPLKSLRIRSRKQAGCLLLFAIGLTTAAVFWPVSTRAISVPTQRLDDFLPRYQFVEYHETQVHAPMERVTEAVRKVSFMDIPLAVFLLRVRHWAVGETAYEETNSRPILDLFAEPGNGFLALDTGNPQEIVYGMVGRPWSNELPPELSGSEEFLAFDAAGQIKVAFNFRCLDQGDGRIRVSTETRIMGNDAESQRIFARYWRIIYPGSSIIRRVWLDAIVSLARDR